MIYIHYAIKKTMEEKSGYHGSVHTAQLHQITEIQTIAIAITVGIL